LTTFGRPTMPHLKPMKFVHLLGGDSRLVVIAL